MKRLKAFALACLGLLAVVWVALVLLDRFGSETSRLRCAGALDGSDQPVTVFLKLELYRPFIFWADSAGQAWSEIPNSSSEYYSTIHKNGDILTLGHSDKPLMGTFSELSNAVMLDMGSGLYKGTCQDASR